MPRTHRHPATAPVSVATCHVTIGNQELYTRTLRPAGRPLSEGLCLVFLHEGLGCTDMWHDFPASVVTATQRPALIYDRQGYGRSSPRRESPGFDYLKTEAETVLPALLDHFSIDAPILIGHSDGGTIALLYAARFPQRVAGIVAEAAHVLVEPATLEGIRSVVRDYETRHLEKKLARYHGTKAREVFFTWADTWLADRFASWNIEDRLAAIRCPVLVLQGEDDIYATPRQVEAIVDGIGPNAAALMIPGCGHFPHREAASVTLDAVVRFINNRQTLPD